MEHYGRVIQVTGQTVQVEIAKSTECAKCKACDMFDTRETIILEAQNDINAQQDDMVTIEVAAKQVLASSVLVFLMPVLFLIFGYWLGSTQLWFSSNPESSGIISALIALLLSFGVIFGTDRLLFKKAGFQAHLISPSL